METIKEVILCKYGELILKGTNRSTFEAQLLREVKRRAKMFGQYDVHANQSTVYVEPLDDASADPGAVDGLYRQLGKVFGFVALCRAAVAEKTVESILETAKAWLPDKLADKKNFKCESRR